MAAITFSADGDNIFYALETGGFPVIVKAARATPGTGTAVYSPGAGSAANVMMVPGNADKVLFYGNFGTDIVVIMHTISTVTNTDISPASMGAKIVNALAVNPSNEDEIVIGVGTDEDLLYTSDGGSNWSAWDATLGFDSTALWVFWSGLYIAHRYFTAGDNGLDLDLLYSPNEGVSSTNEESTALGSQANICSLEGTEA
jgi:hypothetical protein